MNKTGILVVLGFAVVIGAMCVLTSCCTSVCEQRVPALRPIPKCEEQQVQPTLEIPVTPTGK